MHSVGLIAPRFGPLDTFGNWCSDLQSDSVELSTLSTTASHPSVMWSEGHGSYRTFWDKLRPTFYLPSFSCVQDTSCLNCIAALAVWFLFRVVPCYWDATTERGSSMQAPRALRVQLAHNQPLIRPLHLCFPFLCFAVAGNQFQNKKHLKILKC